MQFSKHELLGFKSGLVKLCTAAVIRQSLIEGQSTLDGGSTLWAFLTEFVDLGSLPLKCLNMRKVYLKGECISQPSVEPFYSRIVIKVIDAPIFPNKLAISNLHFILQRFVDYVLVKRALHVFALVCNLCSLLWRNGFCK